MAQVEVQLVLGKMRGNGAPKSLQMLRSCDIAELLGISLWTVKEWRRLKQGPPFLKLSRRTVRYPRSLVELYLRSRISGGEQQVIEGLFSSARPGGSQLLDLPGSTPGERSLPGLGEGMTDECGSSP
jgi:predicted DNA-binding transcriptional regulator AlpA